LAAVEGGILPPGVATLNAEVTVQAAGKSAGQDARLYGRLEACRYAKQIRTGTVRGPAGASASIRRENSVCAFACLREILPLLITEPIRSKLSQLPP